MNEFDLPPRESLPADVRTRIRATLDTATGTGSGAVSVVPPSAPPRRVRSRAPLAVAAGVAALAMGAAVLTQSGTGTPDGDHRGAASTAGSPLTRSEPDARTNADLDHCATVVAASPRAAEFAPRSEWSPVFTVTTPEGARITGYRESGQKPMFCVVGGNTATVSDPTANPRTFGNVSATDWVLYQSPSGVLAGFAQVENGLEFAVLDEGQDGSVTVRSAASPVFDDQLFVVDVGELGTGDGVTILTRDRNDRWQAGGTYPHDPSALPPVGATGTF
ncbi:hypothetical protein [Actinophytocola sp. NPDC049390]|uniref:hypothetical protein n=1 Tax=Actinophytocola sp. NPDC049390 TaxID=3363894 RepID=UPI0037A3B3B3